MRAARALTYAWIPWAALAQSPSELKALSGLEHARVKLIQSDAPECASGAESGKTFRVAIAATHESQQRGLSGRRNPLAADEGMLFVYPGGTTAPFWMKETYLPLSIAFFDAGGNLVGTFEMPVEPLPSAPQKLYRPSVSYSVALEAQAGSFDGLKAGKTRLCVEKAG